MAYISTDEVKEVRKALKEKFGKNLKFSVRRQNYSSIDVSIVSGKVNFFDGSMDSKDKYSGRVAKFDGYTQINEYYPEYYGKHEQLFRDIVEIMKSAPANANGGRAWYDNSDAMIDYFDTAYYTHVSVGKWDKPYELTA
jgi:hypothetical protein